MTLLKQTARTSGYLYIFIFCMPVVSSVNADGLQFLQILYRHGDRSPIHLYPTDPNSLDIWPEGLGKLTKLGREQHYNLGKYFHKRYENFISTDPNEIDVQSSDVDRCLKSALTNLATFYEPSVKWKFEKSFNWQPITVLYLPIDQDKYLEVDSYCPEAFKEAQKILSSPKGKEIIKEYQALFDNLTENSGLEIENWKDASYLYDTLKIEKLYNMSVPSWADANWEQLHHIGDMSFYWSYDSKLIQKLRAGPLIGKIVENMKLKSSGEKSMQDKKVQIFSAHDTNVALVMQSLNVMNWKQPPYCSSLIFELHRLNGNYSVHILFLNSTDPEKEIGDPHVLVLNGCTEYCPLDFFIEYTADIIPKDWEADCKLEPSFFDKISKTSIAVPVVFTVLAVGLLAVSTYSVWKFQFRGRDRYSYHLMSDMSS